MTSEIEKFWASLISSENIKDHLKSVTEVSNIEERALLLISRMLFVYTMG